MPKNQVERAQRKSLNKMLSCLVRAQGLLFLTRKSLGVIVCPQYCRKARQVLLIKETAFEIGL